MLSKEAVKAKKKFQNLGTLINLLSLNPKKLSKPKIISQRLNFILLFRDWLKNMRVLFMRKFL